MAPKGTKHKSKQGKRKGGQALGKRMHTLNIDDEASAPQASTSNDNNTPNVTTAAAPANDTDVDEAAATPVSATIPPETSILLETFPLYDEWEKLEAAEAKEVEAKHASKMNWLYPERLPVLVHVAAPQAGRFTREIQSDIEEMNSIEAVKDLVKTSLIHELVRTNIDPARARFAGLMVYGPTTEFAKISIRDFTRGMFLQEAAFKKWWMDVNMTVRTPGEMVKIAVILWDQDEAAAQRVNLPDFWTNENARILAMPLANLEMPIWDLEFEQGARSYVAMQKQVLEERIKASNPRDAYWKGREQKLELQMRQLVQENGRLVEENGRLTRLKDDLADANDEFDEANDELANEVEDLTKKADNSDKQLVALASLIENGDLEEAARFAHAVMTTAKGKGKAKDVVEDGSVGYGDEDAEDDVDKETDNEEMKDFDDDDPDDKDYVDT